MTAEYILNYKIFAHKGERDRLLRQQQHGAGRGESAVRHGEGAQVQGRDGDSQQQRQDGHIRQDGEPGHEDTRDVTDDGVQVVSKQPIGNMTVGGETLLKHGDLVDLNIDCSGSQPWLYCWQIKEKGYNITGWFGRRQFCRLFVI